jgi:hypothetical protein
MIIFHVAILNCSQCIKQFQKSLSDLAVSKLDFDVSVRDTFNWLFVSLFLRKGATVITAAVPQAAISENLAT